MNKEKVIILGLSIALILTLQYFVLDNWAGSMNETMLENSQDAYNQGLTDAIATIYQQTENCQAVPIILGNFTKTVFDVSCIAISPSP